MPLQSYALPASGEKGGQVWIRLRHFRPARYLLEACLFRIECLMISVKELWIECRLCTQFANMGGP